MAIDEIKTVKLLYYQPRDIKIELPTHYNKHSKIFNSYKYDVSQMVLTFMKYKILNGELKFTINDEFNEIDFLTELHKSSIEKQKKLYTKVSGLLVKQQKMFYTEYLHSSIKTIEDLLKLNQKMGLDFKILKIFVDEVIIDTKLLATNIRNEFSFNFKESFFRLFVKSLPTLRKQIYITDNKIELDHNFTEKSNLITDLEVILDHGVPTDMIHSMTTNIISGEYSSQKLIQINDQNQLKYIKSEDNVDIPVEYIPDLENFKYSRSYYYKIYREIASNLIYVKGLLWDY